MVQVSQQSAITAFQFIHLFLNTLQLHFYTLSCDCYGGTAIDLGKNKKQKKKKTKATSDIWK